MNTPSLDRLDLSFEQRASELLDEGTEPFVFHAQTYDAQHVTDQYVDAAG